MKLKKVLAPCLAALLLLTTVGCSSSDSKEEGYSGIGKNTFSLSETNIVENICEYNVKSIVKSSKVEPSITSTYYTFYEVKTEGNTYVDITLDVKNLKKEDEQADDLMTAKTKVGGQEYKAFSVVESSDGTKLESYGSIKPLETKLVHYLVEVPETVTKEEIEIILTIDGKDYKNKVNLESVKPKKEVIEIGKRLEKEGFAELTIENLSFTDRLEPSNPSGYYRYYEATSSDDIYLVLEASVKNLKSSDLDGKKVLGAKAIYNKQYKYDGFCVIEDKDGSNISTYGDIKPLDTQKLYFLIEMPKESEGGNVEVELNFQGQKYYIVVK